MPYYIDIFHSLRENGRTSSGLRIIKKKKEETEQKQ